MNLAANIEAVLFFTGESMTVRELAKMLSVSEEEIRTALAELKERLTDRGVSLMENGDEITLRTNPATTELILKIRKEELEKDLGKAGLETLAIIVYQGPVTRARIDYIRGVNSAFIVRQLMVRGLIERVDNPTDQRSFLYKPSLELLSFLGLSSLDDLSDLAAVRSELASFESRTEDSPVPHASTEPTHSAGDVDEPTSVDTPHS